jgi:hypothetical protein
MGVKLAALLWGLAEATVFFIVPDVWLSFAGRTKLRAGLAASLYCLAGAMAGGALIYLWGRHDLSEATDLVEKVPAISTAMVERVQEELSEMGVLAVLFGPLKGTPYKVYAAQAFHAGIGIWLFLLISIPARLIRFVLVTAFCYYALKGLVRWRPGWNRVVVLFVGWVLFYIFYFTVMPG